MVMSCISVHQSAVFESKYDDSCEDVMLSYVLLNLKKIICYIRVLRINSSNNTLECFIQNAHSNLTVNIREKYLRSDIVFSGARALYECLHQLDRVAAGFNKIKSKTV